MISSHSFSLFSYNKVTLNVHIDAKLITRSVTLELVFVSTCVYSWVALVVMSLSFFNTMQVTLFLYLFYIIVIPNITGLCMAYTTI